MQENWQELKNLIIRSQNGDKEAYRQFLQHLYPWVESKVKSKVFNKHDCSDVTQNIMLSLHKALATFNEAYDLAPWVNIICKRRIVDYIRRTSRNQELFELSGDEGATNYMGAANIESIREQYELLSNLPDKLLQPILLTKILGHSTTEAAEILNIKENALRTRLSRAFRLIEQNLDKNI
jgi:RNA polymerase sigma-70 factor (ECF subfamily)